MGKSSPAGSTTQTTSNIPFGQGYFYNGQTGSPNTIFGQAYNIGNTKLQFPNFQTYASPTAQQNQAISAQTNLAQNDPTMQAATGGIQPYLNGSMLNAGNPYLQNAFNSAAQTAIPDIQSGFESNGRFGSGAAANAQASALTNLAGTMAYQNYNDQSTNQLKAMLEAPGISSGNFQDIANLSAAGAQQQAFNQLPITQALQQFQFKQDEPFLRDQRYESLLSGQGNMGTSTSPYFTNPIGSALGTGIGALGLYNMGNQATGGSFNSGLQSLYNNNTYGSGISGIWNSLFGVGAGDAGSAAGAAAGGLT